MTSFTEVKETDTADPAYTTHGVTSQRFFRPKPQPRVGQVGRGAVRTNLGSRVVPRTRGNFRAEEEPSGSQRWLKITDDPEADYEDLLVEVVPETNEFISEIIDALNFVSVMGPTRSGKSTLMNLLAECKVTELFPTANGGIPFTKGIDLGNKIMSVEEFSRADGGQEVAPIVAGQKIAFLDTEGQGDQGDGYDISLFTPAILCSRIVIFNTKEVAKDTILTQLALMTTIAQRIILDGDAEGETPGPKFGHLMITINQYTLGGTVEELERNILGMEEGSSAAVKRRNQIREMLRVQFEDITMHILRGNTLKPGVAEDLASGVKKFLLLDDFLPVYVADFLVLRSVFSEKLRRSRIVAGESMSGQSAAGLVPAIVEAINLEDPLDIPDLWEQTQNAAISKASLQFRTALRVAFDAALESETLLTTVQLTRLLESEIEQRLYDVERALSYIPAAKIAATRKLLSDEAEIEKQNVLALNLVRIKSFTQIELVSVISAFPKNFDDEFPTLLVSNTAAASRVEQLKARILNDYKAMVTGYDVNGFPENYHGRFDTAFASAQTIKLEEISQAWAVWVVGKDDEILLGLRATLAKLTEDTAVGDLVKWKQAAESLRLSTVTNYNGIISTSYLWNNPTPAVVKTNFVAKVRDIIDLAEQGFKQDEEAAKELIEALLATKIQSYQNHLRNSLTPTKEPGEFTVITNATVYRNALVTQMENSNVSESLTNYYLLDFDTKISKLKDDFRGEYTAASNEFLAYLVAELAINGGLLVGDFKLRADSIKIDKNVAKAALVSQLDSIANSVLATFDSDVMRFEITQEPGRTRLETARRTLLENINTHRLSKYTLLKDAVDEWNRTTLNADTAPVITGVVDFTIDTTAKLTTAISRAKDTFWAHACGDESEKLEAWGTFDRKSAGLFNNVRRASALFIGKVNASEGTTDQMEKIVMAKIYATVANLANNLGMSWVSSGREWLVETSTEDKARSHKYKNVPVSDQGYDWQHPTSLKFHKWRVEFSDFEFDDPIVQEMTPFTINEFEPPPQDVDTITNVELTQSEKETITNTNSSMFKFDMEYSTTSGIKDVASTTVKMAFGGSSTFTEAKANEIGFSISFKTPVVCPAHRKTRIIHLGFKQRLSMTYTAKVKIVPLVQFTGGFTVWGGGPYTNPANTKPNYHKRYTGDRHYGDIDNGYADELRAKAAADSDPWAWRACISRFPSTQNYVNSLGTSSHYELYVRGKWEGINGWKHVVKRNISVLDTK